jgi:hypothetical protein
MSALVIGGDVSGTVTLQAPSAAGATVLTLPATSGTLVTTAGGTASSATNLAGGSAGTIPYQSTSDTTAMLAAGSSNQLLVSGGAGAPSWSATLSGLTLTTPVLTNPTVTNYVETPYTANSSTAITLDLANGTVQIITLTGSPTITMPAAVSGKSFMLLLKTGAGSYTVTWSSVQWPSGTAPTLTSTASKMDKFVFTSDGTYWYGSIAGQNYSA